MTATTATLALLGILHLCLVVCDAFPRAIPRKRAVPAMWGATTETREWSNLSSPSVICIGDALFDCIANDDARGWSVETMVENNAWTAFPGGAPANVATACCKLGTSSAFVGCVGLDEDGDKLETLFRDIGVDVTLLQRAKENFFPTRRVMVTRSLEGDREFGGFYGGRSADEFADCQLDSSLLFRHDDDEDHRGAAIIDGASWLVCSTLSLAFEKSADAIYKCIDRGLESGARLYVDINWRPVFWPSTGEIAAREEIRSLARRAHIVKMTDEEAEWLLGVPASEALSDPARVHDEFPKAVGVFVTAGEKGASYSMLGDSGHIEPFQVDVQETTGAGDAFTAGILHSLLNLGIDLDSFDAKVSRHERPVVVNQFVRFAAAVGALTCTKEGAIAAQPTISEVENFLSRKEQVSL